MLRIVRLPYCRVAMAAPWDEPPARRFAAYRCRDGFRRLLGHPVVDEFATLSAPVILGPSALAGRLYDAGLTLAHRRDPEMAIDRGWPPLVVGLPGVGPAPELPADWQEALLAALAAPAGGDEPLAAADGFARRRVGAYGLERVRVGEAVLWATDAPLLPKQLGRLCEASAAPFTLALSTRRLARLAAGAVREIEALSEARLVELLAAAGEIAA
ncbi:MAG: hypothetical protein OES32_19430 [Acidobacteriota bacterium]|nr:hypothetical protein [Acidobacteriota bacterium]